MNDALPLEQGASDDALARDPRTGEILDIVATETGVARALLTPDASIEALGIPSLDLVQTVFALETRYDIEIPVVASGDGGGEFETVGALVAHVLATIDRKSASRSTGASGSPA